jgi:hypothetical protein
MKGTTAFGAILFTAVAAAGIVYAAKKFKKSKGEADA